MNNQPFMNFKQIFSHRLNFLCRRVILAYSLLFLFGNLCYSQTWMPVGLGTNSPIYAMAVYKGDMYVGGTFSEAGGKTANLVAKWDGKVWEPVGKGFDKIVHTLEVYDDQLYAGGEFNRADNKPAYRIAKWDGKNWGAVGLGMDSIRQYAVYSLKVFKGYLYAAGGFENVIGSNDTKRIAKWDGKTWKGVGGGMDYAIGSLEVFNNNLYASGPFITAGGRPIKHVARWNDTTWVKVGNGFNELSGSVLKVYNNELYLGGYFTEADGISAKHIAKWNGNSWIEVGGGMDLPVLSLEVYNNELYAGGQFKKAGSSNVNFISKWNGSKWIDVAGGMDNRVTELLVYDNELFAAGEFEKAGGKTVMHIAKLGTTGKITQGDPLLSSSIFPNPSDGMFYFTTSEIKNEMHLEIYALSGKLVKSMPIVQKSTEINLEEQNQGIYYLKVLSEDGIEELGKLVIQ